MLCHTTLRISRPYINGKKTLLYGFFSSAALARFQSIAVQRSFQELMYICSKFAGFVYGYGLCMAFFCCCCRFSSFRRVFLSLCCHMSIWSPFFLSFSLYPCLWCFSSLLSFVRSLNTAIKSWKYTEWKYMEKAYNTFWIAFIMLFQRI